MRPLRILLVEDEPVLAFIFAELLRELGHDVCAVENTESDAIAAAALWKPELMIVDEYLAAGSGMNAVEAILQTGYVPHLFISVDIKPIAARRPDAVIVQKPFHARHLTSAMMRAMEQTTAV